MIGYAGLFSLSPSTEFTCKEILNCLRLSKEGIDAVLVVYSLRNRLTEEERSSLFALKILFGSEIVDYMIVVFTNEDAFEEGGGTLDGYLKNCPDFNVSAGLKPSSLRFIIYHLLLHFLLNCLYGFRKFLRHAMTARCCLETEPMPLRVRKLSKFRSCLTMLRKLLGRRESRI